ncbi:neuroblast differentiation-associated protein AHNAK isoform X13 [Erpetoichthys calabaricus]|uniref:neuroblast differentiation-associated protein AHNAK isoform X13 n=1 Tax=Erpetoichthys calabaricus TaxID=27687 RepID=UPI0022344492|nr:neuroblast differentiation-associated protein AHNAK isoform X13 [Erpetoichthys calabaricus]
MSEQSRTKRSRSLSDSLILEDSEDGSVVVKDISDAGVADSSGIKEGDELVGATIYFDTLKKDDVLKLMKLTDQYNAQMKVITKRPKVTPDVAWESPNISIRRPEAMLRNSTYDKLFNNKIKKHLKLSSSCENIFSEPDIHSSGLKDNFNADFNEPKMNLKGPKVNVNLPEGSLEGPTSFDIHSAGNVKLKGPDSSFDGSLKTPDIHFGGPNIKGGINVPDIDLKMPKADIKGPHISMPSFGGGKVKGPELNMDGKLNSPDVDISAPDIKGGFHAPDIDVNMPKADIKGPKFHLPSFGGGKVKGPELNVDGKVNTPDVNLSTPDIKGGIHAPDIDLKMPKADIKGPTFSLPSFGGGKVKGPELDVDGKINTPDLDISAPDIKGGFHAPDIDVNMPKADIKGPKFHLPSFGGGKVKGPELNVDGKVNTPDVNISTPDMKGGIHAPDIDLKMPKADIKGPKFNLPSFGGGKVKGPELDVDGKMNTPDVHISAPDIKGGVHAPDIDLKMPKADIKGPKFHLPSFGGGKVKGPELDVDGKMNTPDVDISAPDIKGGVHAPDIDLKMPKADIKGPKFNLPSFGGGKVKGPELDVDGKMNTPDVDISAPDIKGGVHAPDIDLKMPKADIKGPKFHLPSFGGGKVKGPELNVDGKVNTPDVNISTPDIKGGIHAPDIDLKMPKADIKGPKFNLPSFGGGKLKGPELNIDGKVNTPDVNISGPDVKGGIHAPDINVKSPKADIKGPKFSLPSWGGTKVKSPELHMDGKVKTPDVNVSSPKIEGDVKTPDIDMNLPKADIKPPKTSKFSFSSWGMSLPRGKSPELDANIKAPNVNVSTPKTKGDLNAPSVNVSSPKGTIKGPKFKFPSWGKAKSPDLHLETPDANISTPNIKTPEVNISAPKVKGPDVDISGPKIEGGIKAPKFGFKLPELDMKAPNKDISIKGIQGDIKEPNVDLTGPEINKSLEIPKLNLPKFGISEPILHGPEVNIDAKLPRGKIDLPDSQLKGNLNAADIEMKPPKASLDMKTPDIELDVPDPKMKSSIFKMPTFNLPGIKSNNPELKLGDTHLPDSDINLKGPNLDIGKMQTPDVNISGPKINKPDVDIKLPNAEFKGPNLDLKGPNVEVGEPSGKFKMPHMKMPDFGISGPKLKGPDIDGNVKVPDVNISGPNINKPNVDISFPKSDIKGPNLDLKAPNVEVGEVGGKLKMPSLKMPDFGISGPKVKSPDVNIDAKMQTPDVSISGPKISKPDVDISLPKAEIKAPNLDLKGPNVEVGEPSGKLKMPSLKMPDFGISGPKVKGPDIDGNVKVPDVKISGPNINKPDVDINLPKADIKGPNLDLKGPNVEVGEPSGRFKMPSLKMPDFGLSRPKIKGPDVNIDAKMQAPDASISGPKISKPDVDISLPKADIKGPNLDLKAPNVEVGEVGGKLKMPSLKMPDFGLSGTKVKGPSFDSDANLKTPEASLNVKGSQPKGEVDVSVPNMHGNIKGFSADIKGPNVDISQPDVKGGDGKFKIPKMTFPSFFASKSASLKASGPQVKENANVDLNTPNISSPEIELDVPDAKLKGPRIKLPTLDGFRNPAVDSNINVKAPSVKGEFEALQPTIHGELKQPNVDVDLSRGNTPKMTMPSVSIPEIDVGTSKHKGGITVSAPKVQGDQKGPTADVQYSKLNMPGININTPKLESSIEAPKVNINMPGVNINGSKAADSSYDAPSLEDTEKNLNKSSPKIDIEAKLQKLKNDLYSKGKVTPPKANVDVDLPEIEGPSQFSGPSIQGVIKDASTPDIHLSASQDIATKPTRGTFKVNKPAAEADKKDDGGDKPKSAFNFSDIFNIGGKKGSADITTDKPETPSTPPQSFKFTLPEVEFGK